LEKDRSIFWASLVTALFIIVNAVLTANEFYLFSLVPVVLIIILLGFFRLDILFFIIVFFVPLSIQLDQLFPNLTFDLDIPTEPLIIGAMLLFFLRVLHQHKFDRDVMRHPVSIAIIFNLLWILVTAFSSSMPLVSFKFFLMRTWFAVVFFFIATQIFKKNENIFKFYWIYIIPFIIVIFYTIYRHAGYGFTQVTSHTMMKPFFNDHTSYGAILAMYIPILGGLIILNSKQTILKSLYSWGALVIFIVAVLLSYTRAAWLSVAIALLVMSIIILKIRFTTIFAISAIFIILIYSYQTEILHRLEQNRTPSSKDFLDHAKSISNIRNDPSNLERLNRWSCALRMFKERPVLGFGPGTYQFKYGAYQLSYEKTRISTNFGTNGNAHSEYFGPLAESGILGSLSFILIIILTVITAVKVYNQSKERRIRILVLISLMSLITYWVHASLNNFLDTDKASAPYWGFIAIIVALDIRTRIINTREKLPIEVDSTSV
jgi:putative inorganic carbon (HCO3(-)) transporter